MASAAEILQFEPADLLISKQKLDRARGIEVVWIKREQRAQDLCFSSGPFVLCGLPVRSLPKHQLMYERRNGRFLLQITGHPEFGVPFGQDRLVPIFLATLAVQQKSQMIRFRTAAEMLESFGMLANQIGTTEYSRPRRFRAMVEQWLDNIRALWPECPTRISPDGQSMMVQHAPAVIPAESVGLR